MQVLYVRIVDLGFVSTNNHNLAQSGSDVYEQSLDIFIQFIAASEVADKCSLYPGLGCSPS